MEECIILMTMSIIHKLIHIKIRYLVPALLITAACTTFFLRSNSLHVRELRSEIVALDTAARDKEVDAKIIELRNFVNSHTNTKLRSGNEPPIQLQGRYERAIKAAGEAASRTQGNSNLYMEAQAHCNTPGKIQYQVLALCIQQYVTDHTPANAALLSIKLPPKELYTYDFVSPTWAPDAAGMGLVLTTMMVVVVLIKTITWRLHRPDQW